MEIDKILIGVLYNKDGTVEYVLNDKELDSLLVPLFNGNAEKETHYLNLIESKEASNE